MRPTVPIQGSRTRAPKTIDIVKPALPLRSLLVGAVLAVAGCATDDSFRLPGLESPPARGNAGGGSTPFMWYYGPGDVPRLNSGPLPFYDPYFYYRYGGLPPRYYGSFPLGYGPGYGPGFGLAYGPGYGQGYPFGPYWPYATAPCRDSNRNGRCDAYEARPPKPPKPPKPPRPGSAGDVIPPPGAQPGGGRSNLPPIVAPGGPRYVPRATPAPPPGAPDAAPSVPSRVPPAVAPPPPPAPRAGPPKPADRGDERERPRRRLPQVEPELDR
jgi:hypothetical protein